MDVHDAVGPPPAEPPGVALEQLVARTNLSEVWRGRRRHDGAPVAVKFATNPASADALAQEAATVRAIEWAGVRGILSAEHASDPVPHLVLPWMPGTLRGVVEAIRGGNDRARALRTFMRVVETVAEVHAERFMHGDLKPENVLVDDRGQPWLTDFGMARAIRSARLDSHVSRSMAESGGGWGGTLHYLPPEGLQGEPPTRAWDVYALGVILHEILLGRRPDRGATPELLRTVLPEKIVEVLLRALAYAPQDRYASAAPFLKALQEIQIELTATGLLRLGLRSKRLVLAGLAALFIALRYTSVLALLAVYASIGIGALAIGLSDRGNVPGMTILIAYVPFLLLHFVIRWEGPESPSEAALRKQGTTIRRR